MKKIVSVVALVLIAVLATTTLVACNSVEGGIRKDGTVLVGATSVPHAEILEFAKDILKNDYNINIEIVELENWAQLNPSTSDGDLYANYFQHGIYLNEYNSGVSEDRQLVSVGAVHVEPLGIYSNKTDVNLTGGNLTIGITNDVTNQSRALRLLEAQGVITAKASAADKEIVTVDDFDWGTNRYSAVNAELLVVTLPDVDISVIPGNYALAGGLEKAIVTETEEVTSQYANVIAVRKGEENSTISKALIEVLTSDAVKQFIAQKYGDAVHAVN